MAPSAMPVNGKWICLLVLAALGALSSAMPDLEAMSLESDDECKKTAGAEDAKSLCGLNALQSRGVFTQRQSPFEDDPDVQPIEEDPDAKDPDPDAEESTTDQEHEFVVPTMEPPPPPPTEAPPAPKEEPAATPEQPPAAEAEPAATPEAPAAPEKPAAAEAEPAPEAGPKSTPEQPPAAEVKPAATPEAPPAPEAGPAAAPEEPAASEQPPAPEAEASATPKTPAAEENTTAAPVMTNCKDAVPGDHCYNSVKWAMHSGFKQHPSWYHGLTKSSSFADFQAQVHRKSPKDCPMAPCASAMSAESCAAYGCHTTYHRDFKCQCNAGCRKHGDCCSDFSAMCAK